MRKKEPGDLYKGKYPKPIPVKISRPRRISALKEVYITNHEGVSVVSKKHIIAQQQRRLREKYISTIGCSPKGKSEKP